MFHMIPFKCSTQLRFWNYLLEKLGTMILNKFSHLLNMWHLLSFDQGLSECSWNLVNAKTQGRVFIRYWRLDNSLASMWNSLVKFWWYSILEVNFFSTILLLLYTIFLLHVLQFLKKTLANNQQKLQLKYFWLLDPFVIFFIRHRKAGT